MIAVNENYSHRIIFDKIALFFLHGEAPPGTPFFTVRCGGSGVKNFLGKNPKSNLGFSLIPS